MTSDAKIGLLLGLVFIFVIAFVINGLPGLHHKDDGNKLTTNMVGLQSNPSGLGAGERKVALETGSGAAPPSGNILLAEGVTGETVSSPATSLPQGAPTTTDTAPVGDNTTIAPIESAPSVSPQAKITAPAQTATATKTQPAQKPVSATPAAPKTYVVQQGDTLSSIAKKVFGEQEGNKLANIRLLFEANRKTLATADDLQVGQKLIVPALTGVTSPAPTPANTLTGSTFSKVDSVGQRHPATNPDKPATAAKTDSSAKPGNIYVVKDGDSLWQIAAERLGDGNRYKEIVKLNTDVLANENDLQVGMQLKLPPK